MTRKTLLITIFILILAIIVVSQFISTEPNIIEHENTYSDVWRSPSAEELVSIAKLMAAKKIRGCGEFELKEVTTGEYVIACTGDGIKWTYYVA